MDGELEGEAVGPRSDGVGLSRDVSWSESAGGFVKEVGPIDAAGAHFERGMK